MMHHKPRCSILSLLFACGLMVSGTVKAEVPRQVTYQGFLSNAVGEPVHCPDDETCPDMSFDFVFRLYDEETGGTPFWAEAHTGVSIRDGRFQVILGETLPLEPTLLTSDVYLGIDLNEEGEMLPRQRLVSSVFALKAQEADHAVEADDAAQLGGLAANAYVQESALNGLCVSHDALAEKGYLDAAAVNVYLTENGYVPGAWLSAEDILDLLTQEGYTVGEHFSGDYAALTNRPDLNALASDAELATHAGAADAHHVRYSDDDARAAVGEHFSGDYAALTNRPDLSALASDEELATHAGTADAHHVRYSDDDARAAVGEHFSGDYEALTNRPDLNALASDAELATHAGNTDAHHTRYTNSEAVAAVGPHFSGAYADLSDKPNLDALASDEELTNHAGVADAHHTRYSDEDARAAVGDHFSGAYADLTDKPDLDALASDAELNTHKTSADHDAQYVNLEGDTMTGALVLPENGLTVESNQLALVDGYVGVGTATPKAPLQAAGSFIQGTAQGTVTYQVASFFTNENTSTKYVHIRTPFNPSLHSHMFHFKVTGYAYGASTKVVDLTYVGYVYQPTTSLSNTAVMSVNGAHDGAIYRGSDGYVYLRFKPSSLYFLSFRVDSMYVGNGRVVEPGEVTVSTELSDEL